MIKDMSNSYRKTKALKVALYFIHLAHQSDEPITNKKLQKLVYYAQAWSLVVNDEKLFNDKIEAWVHGPAIPSLYSKFKSFEFNPIEIDTSKEKFNFSKKQRQLLEKVWDVYGKYDAEYLEALSHSELPWQEARKELNVNESSTNTISLKTMRNFYETKLKGLK